MFVIEKTRDRSRMTAPPPLGPGFDEQTAGAACIMEVHGTSINDSHERCIFVLRDAQGRIVGEKTLEGY